MGCASNHAVVSNPTTVSLIPPAELLVLPPAPIDPTDAQLTGPDGDKIAGQNYLDYKNDSQQCRVDVDKLNQWIKEHTPNGK